MGPQLREAPERVVTERVPIVTEGLCSLQLALERHNKLAAMRPGETQTAGTVLEVIETRRVEARDAAPCVLLAATQRLR